MVWHFFLHPKVLQVPTCEKKTDKPQDNTTYFSGLTLSIGPHLHRRLTAPFFILVYLARRQRAEQSPAAVRHWGSRLKITEIRFLWESLHVHFTRHERISCINMTDHEYTEENLSRKHHSQHYNFKQWTVQKHQFSALDESSGGLAVQ